MHEPDETPSFAPRLSLTQELGRKSFHVAGVVLPVACITLGPDLARPALLGLTVLVLLADFLRLRWGFARRVYGAAFAQWSRAGERRALTGASMFVVGQTLTALLFPMHVAAVAMAFGALGDPAAAVLGKRYGRFHWRPDKSLQGSLACLLVSFIGGSVIARMPRSLVHLGVAAPVEIACWAVLVGALAATLAEGLSGRLSDNLTIPLVSGLAMWTLVGVGG